MNSDVSTGFVGKGAKGTSEFNIFQKWDLSDIPKGSRIDGANWKFRTSANAAGSGSMHFGLLYNHPDPFDDIWNTSSGFNQGTTAGDEYTQAFAFPDNDPLDAPPHATQDGFTTIESLRIFLNLFTGGPFSWTASNPASEVDVTFGDGIGGETYSFGAVSAINAWRNQLTPDNTGLGCTWDSNAVGSSTQFLVYMDKIDNGKEPTLTIVYTLNPPAFTSAPVLRADSTCAFSYTATANPYSLGDKTNGSALDLTFSLTTFPAGMTVNASTGVFSWTPTVAQQGASYNVVLRVANEGGIFSNADQVFIIVVPLVGFPFYTSTPVLTADVSCPYPYTATADAGVETCQSSTITFSLLVFPTGMSIASGTGVVTWTPTNGQEETSFPVTICVVNFAGNATEQSYSVFVPKVGTPFFTSLPSLVATKDVLYVYDADADANVADCQSDTVTFELLGTEGVEFPDGMTIVTATGVINWTPTAAQDQKSHTVSVRATNFFPRTVDQIYMVSLIQPGPGPSAGEATIANGALVLLGEKLIPNLDSQALSAKLIKDRFNDVRDDLLRTLPWNFATRRAVLAAEAVSPANVWARSFHLPDDFIRLLHVEDRDGWAYLVEGQSIITDLPAPLNITYVARITEVDEMDALFRYTLSASLAVEIAEVVTGDSQKLQNAFDAFQSRLAAAWTVNGQEKPPSTFAVSDWERVRGREN